MCMCHTNVHACLGGSNVAGENVGVKKNIEDVYGCSLGSCHRYVLVGLGGSKVVGKNVGGKTNIEDRYVCSLG